MSARRSSEVCVLKDDLTEVLEAVGEIDILVAADCDALCGKPPASDLVVLNFHVVGRRLPFAFF